MKKQLMFRAYINTHEFVKEVEKLFKEFEMMILTPNDYVHIHKSLENFRNNLLLKSKSFETTNESMED